MEKASYDVTFVPMTNVTIDTDTPENPTEEQQERIAVLAAEKIRENFPDKINCENLAHIRLYSVNGHEKPNPRTVFDNGCLRESADPVDEAVRMLTDLAHSGYIPFSSPCPSSTEKKLRNCITSAISLLETAQQLEKDLNYR